MEAKLREEIEGVKETVWLKYPDGNHGMVSNSLIGLDAIITMLVGLGAKFKVKVDQGCHEIDILHTLDGSEPTFNRYAKISLHTGNVYYNVNSLN